MSPRAVRHRPPNRLIWIQDDPLEVGLIALGALLALFSIAKLVMALLSYDPNTGENLR